MTTSPVLKRSIKAPLSGAHKQFNKLKNRVERLQSEIEKAPELLDQALLFYVEELKPVEQQRIEGLCECIKLMYHHYNCSRKLTRKERASLRQLIREKVNQLSHSTPFREIDREILDIYEEMMGFDFEAIAQNNLSLFKEEVAEFFKEKGMDLDLSKLHLHDSEEQIMHKMNEAIQQAHSDRQTAPEEERDLPGQKKKKSEKEVAQEEKAKELEKLQKNGVAPIYKQLAKLFHPDLEQDPMRKVEKERLMKRLTSAYKNNDLYALLSLEKEWLHERADRKGELAQEQLDLYNTMLQEQVEKLQESLSELARNPKYLKIQHYVSDLSPSLLFRMQDQLNQAALEAAQYQDVAQDLKGKGALETLKAILQ